MPEWDSAHPPLQGIVLDIGKGVGALIVYTGPELRGHEIEVSPIADTTRRTHTEVLERSANGQTICAAVFASLPQGTYHLWRDDQHSPEVVAVESGHVAERDWR